MRSADWLTPASGVSAKLFSIVNAVAFRPIPSVRTPMTVNAKPGFLASARIAYRTSFT